MVMVKNTAFIFSNQMKKIKRISGWVLFLPLGFFFAATKLPQSKQ